MTTSTKVIRKKPIRKKSNKKTKLDVLKIRIKWILIVVLLLGSGIWFGVVFKNGLDYWFESKGSSGGSNSVYDIRNVEVLSRHSNMMVGFDVSQYQGLIAWDQIDSVASHSLLEFVFIRATMGVDGLDRGFDLNWRSARANHFIRGAYHYYRPNENSSEQALNFIRNVQLKEGDFPPVLDIEELPKSQSMDSLRLGLKNWIDLVEKHYQVKPILYSGEHYYVTHLKEWFPDHILWIANYNFFVEKIKPEWDFWQFTEKGVIPGIDGKVDLNIYSGTRSDIRKIVIR